MIDRAARDELAAAIEGFLDGHLTARPFEEQTFAIAERTADEVVQKVVHEVWHFYDDFEDHEAELNKSGWDYAQRLLLVLRSDVGCRESCEREWNETHALAAAGLIGFIALAYRIGWGSQLFILAVPAFHKRRLHETPAQHNIGDAVVGGLSLLSLGMAWLMFAPIALLRQTLPDKRDEGWVEVVELLPTPVVE